MTISPDTLATDGFGTLFKLLNEGGGNAGFETSAATTTNIIPTSLYVRTVPPGSTLTIRIAIVAVNSSGLTVGKFIREMTAKRVGTAFAILLQDLVPSPDYTENINLAVSCSVNGTNAVVLVQGLAATVVWHGLAEVLS